LVLGRGAATDSYQGCNGYTKPMPWGVMVWPRLRVTERRAGSCAKWWSLLRTSISPARASPARNTVN